MKSHILFICVFGLFTGGFLSVFADDIVFNPADYDGYDAVMLEARGYFDHQFTRELSRKTYTYKIGFVTRKGIEDYGDYTVRFFPARENVSDVGGTVYLPDGTTVSIGRSEILRKPIVRRGRARQRELSIAFPSLEVGAVVEFTYSRSYTGLRQLSYWPFQTDLFTLHSEVTFVPWHTYPWGYSITNNIETAEIQETRPGGNPAYTFTRKNIPALTEESYSLAYSCLRESIHFFYKDTHVDAATFWSNETQRVYRQQFRQFMSSNRAARNIVSDEINAQDFKSDEERLFAVYDYVISNYTALSMLSREEMESITESDLNSLSNVRNLRRLLQHNFVTDLQINYILAALIDAAFPKADINLVFGLPWDEGCVDPNTQSFHQFSEYLLKVTIDNQSWWFSPSKRFMPPNMTESALRGTQVFVLGENSAAFEQLPLDDFQDNVSRTVSEITFDPEEGLATTERRTEYNRYRSYDLRCLLLYFPEQERGEVKENLAKDIFGDEVEIIDFSVENLESYSEPLILKMVCEYPYELDQAGDMMLMDLQGLVFPRTNPFDVDERHSRIMFNYPHVIEREVTWNLPEEYVFKSRPGNVIINSPRDVLMYRVSYNKVDDRQLEATWRKALRGSMVRQEALGFLKETYNEIIQAGNQHVVVERESSE